jgi:paraquat-inducible protein B
VGRGGRKRVSEERPPDPPAEPPAEPLLVRRRRRLSRVWIIPLVACLVAAWLGFTTFSERGPTVRIIFRTGEGLEAGKTRVKHNDVELGVVERVELSEDLSHVIVTAQMNKIASTHLNAGTRFWVVRPRLSISNFSGLETLVSGAYVEMDPGEGEASREFVGLEDPPVVRADVPGREYILTTDRLGSIGPGSPIYFRSINVGQVLGYDFSEAGRDIQIHAFIRSPYDKEVYNGSRFWNDSGITISAGASGFKFQMESLQAVLAGGIGFDTPDPVRVGEPSKEGAIFHLYPDRETVLESSYVQRVPFLLQFDASVHGLEVGAPVEFRGIKVGNVTDIHLEYETNGDIRIPVTVDFEPQRVQRAGLSADSPSAEARVLQVMSELVSRGLRAQLKLSSLITGQLIVSFDFFPDAPPAKITFVGKIAQLPTVPSDIEALTTSLQTILKKVAALPLDDLVHDVRDFMQSLRAVTDAPELRESIRNLSKTLGDADKTLAIADDTMKQVDTALASVTSGYGGESQVRTEIVDLLRQLQETAKSVKLLTDYLEQHPESLLRGKGGAPQ